MFFFYGFCLIISTCAIGLSLWVYRQAPAMSGFDRQKALYDRFVDEVSLKLAKGFLAPDLAQEEKTAAARALLVQEKAYTTAVSVKPALVMLIMFLIGGASFGLYFVTGKPGVADTPYAQRLKLWQAQVTSNPDALSYAELAAVLRQYKGARANDPRYWAYLGQTELKAQNALNAVYAYEALTRLAPKSAPAFTQLGVALTQVTPGEPNPEARRAFETALSLDDRDFGARYFLAGILASEGELAPAKKAFERLAAELSPQDARLEVIRSELTDINALEAQTKVTQAQIKTMVEGLAQSLNQKPDNPEGWARLIRSYHVLGDTKSALSAEARVRALYADDQTTLNGILQTSKAAVGAQQRLG
jgi:cytochrome c-type biogenesis protein CcmH